MAVEDRIAPAAAGSQQTQFVLINLLKAVAAQLIVLHHLAFYGPMADHARPLAPALFDWLAGDARIAVQVFLVIGGFLAAKSLAPDGVARPGNPLSAIWRRYVKLAPPFIVATLLAAGASAIASMWMTHESISAAPSVSQLAAHVLLLHSVLGYESLSAGAWYVAIDFQLYAGAALLLWLCGRLFNGPHRLWLVPGVLTVVVVSSLFYFNRDADWDVWAPYFFGSYGLGMLAWWAGDAARRPRAVLLLFLMMAVPTLVALMLDFRSRIAVALSVACVLMLLGRVRVCSSAGWSVANWLGKNSYSIFLVHFPVCLIVNSGFNKFVPAQAGWQLIGTVVAWAASIAGGAMFFRCVEAPLGRMTRITGGSRAVQALRGLAAKDIVLR
ncbi:MULTISPECIES: acyltransferase [unclassified Massilia]|uniref:acyltransferase family protein n=1 Tax=unclassified Massilia TaxID=2609279 RepID=UPI00177CEF9C|nr:MULTISPECIES: acyltransferase [unclassified Massilia]MBD8532097.1 acyltransferase [Massilia sp. CFBP 13647]MBD8675543.1 acyltransferase [Massilia sp. CFBP 13721]